VLLHGIGSGAASWLPCALELAPDARVIAWNAPGYGNSAPLALAMPNAADYAGRLQQMLDAIGGLDKFVLVGHSLGALVATAYAQAHPQRITRLVLLSPAQGYGTDEKRARGAEIRQTRLNDLASIGVAGMAERSPARMLSSQASDDARAWVRWNTAQLKPAGYTQAVQLLCGDAIGNYAIDGIAGAVFCGSADVVTTPDDSAALAQALSLPYATIAAAGHACYIEQPASVAAAIRQQF
jgi:pimeloyl-ACP methyl ester carboxylesterase